MSNILLAMGRVITSSEVTSEFNKLSKIGGDMWNNVEWPEYCIYDCPKWNEKSDSCSEFFDPDQCETLYEKYGEESNA